LAVCCSGFPLSKTATKTIKNFCAYKHNLIFFYL
jgi:hypothetical protein